MGVDGFKAKLNRSYRLKSLIRVDGAELWTIS